MLQRKANDWAVCLMQLFFFSMLFGCTSQPTQDLQAGLHPTPTSGPNLQANDIQNWILLDNTQEEQQLIPTLAALFRHTQTKSEPGVSLQTTPAPVGSRTNSDASQIDSELKTKDVVIFDEALNPNWIFQRTSGIEVGLGSDNPAHSGTSSIEITPNIENGMFLMTVNKSSSENYLRENVLGLSFWIYSGEETLWTDALAVTILGSNTFPYWVPNDQSVENIYEPVFSETRLYYLGINQSVPPNTWVQIELWLDERIYDPDYQFVTGFYIKNDDSVLRSIYIDDVKLITIDDVSGTDSTTGDIPGQDASTGSVNTNQVAPLWIVQVDAAELGHKISPLIYGVTTADEEYLAELNLPLNSWGGNPSSRYNWKIGHAWNAGRDYFFRNGNYGITSGSASDMFIEKSLEVNAEVRLTIPTLGWVAKNDDLNTCSFPLPNGECGDVPHSKCETPIQVADPFLANVRSDVNSIREWMEYLFDLRGYDIRFIAMDNEPELWGWTHYDVHPECTTYQEVYDKFIEYATTVREVAPEVEITGPITSGWYHYWNSSAGAADKVANGNQHFLPWFLDRVREFDEENSIRTLDVLDIHYYPQGVYNEIVDKETSALRLRSTRSLWDPNYVDESWIAEAVNLIPRMKQIIEDHYPGTRLGISEWNWGAEQDINGALAIADILGIFGREDLYFATYYSFPPKDSPGSFAFKMYRNFDGQGSSFGDTSVWSQSTDANVVSSFATIDSDTGNLHLMLINKEPEDDIPLQIYLNGFTPGRSAEQYQYSQADLTSIIDKTITIPGESFDITVPAYSITLLVIKPVR